MVTILLENEKYQLEVQKGIEALVKYHMDNPCLSEEMDYKVDDDRYSYYKKQFKGLDIIDVVEQITFLVDDDQLKVDSLLNNKVIFSLK